MAGHQTLPPITSLTDQLPSSDHRLSSGTDLRDSGNWSQSKHSSTVSSNPGLNIQTILNTDSPPSHGSGPTTPQSARHPSQSLLGLRTTHTSFPPSGTDTSQAGYGPSWQGDYNLRPSIDGQSILDSRRSSVDSRMNSGMNHLAISPSSPYESQNQSRTSLVSNLQQQRGITDTRLNGSGQVSPSMFRTHRTGLDPQRVARPPVVAPVIVPNPRSVSGMPDPLAQNPTRGYAWAFPDKADTESEERRASSESSMENGKSIPSRQNSFAASMNSSILTSDSHLPLGQRRLEEVGDLHTHHHSIQAQHRQVTQLQSDGQLSVGGGNYSRTPELRVSHKIAERKRRSEMKSLFDELNILLPNSPGSKSSKWETLSKACDYIKQLKGRESSLQRDNERLRGLAGSDNNGYHSDTQSLRANVDALRTELSACYSHMNRVQPNSEVVFGAFGSSFMAGLPHQNPHTVSQSGHSLSLSQPIQQGNHHYQNGSAPMEGVQGYAAR